MLEIDRRQTMAYRIAAQGLHRKAGDRAALAVFDLGVQDESQRDSADLAVLARRDCAPHAPHAPPAPPATDDRFTLAWSHRGAPHYHRAAEYRTRPRAGAEMSAVEAEADRLRVARGFTSLRLTWA